MWYRCEAFGQWNQVHQLQLLQKITLMKNCEFFEDMSKLKKYKSCIIYHIPRLKCLIFFVLKNLSWIMQNSWKWWTRDQNIDSYQEISFLGKYAVFIKNENEFLKNSDFCYTWSYAYIQQVFQTSERSDQYYRRSVILKSCTFGTALCAKCSNSNRMIL